MIKYLIIIIAILFSSLFWLHEAGATAHYVDCSAGTNGSGTYASPWNVISSVNSHSFSTGDDVYFKVNTTCTPSTRLIVDWSGSDVDQVIIGAYYGDGQFGLNSNSRPIFDGDNSFPGPEQPMLTAQDQDYVTFKDLKVIDSAGYAITIKNGDYCSIENCYVDHTYRIGIGLFRTKYSSITDNICNNAYYWTSIGNCIGVSALDEAGLSEYNTVARNIVTNCNEGIGAYQKARYATIEHNVVYDTDYAIYSGAGKYITMRYNLVYSTSTPKSPGIAFDNEAARNYCYTGDNYVYGNLVANMTQGILITNNCGANTNPSYPNCDTSCNTNNMLIYNNTFVDNNTNIVIRRDDAGWSGNEINNNISWTITDGMVHAEDYSPEGFTWSHNLFDDSVSGDAATNARIGNPDLSKSSGWRSLTAGELDGEEFKPRSDSAPGVDQGISISGYNDRIFASDYNGPGAISVTTETDSPPDIGAFMIDVAGSDIRGVKFYGIKFNP